MMAPSFIMLMSAMGVHQVIVCASFHDVRIVSSCAHRFIRLQTAGDVARNQETQSTPGRERKYPLGRRALPHRASASSPRTGERFSWRRA
jgi:hypothetical protein